MKFFRTLFGVLPVILSFFLWMPLEASNAAGNVPTCNTDYLAQVETTFQQMVSIRAENPHAFSDEEYKVAALNYIAGAEECYHATVPANIPAGGPAHSDPITIDEGGLSPYENKITPFYNTGALKWGANSPYSPSGQNVPGPGIAGGTVTYSYMANGINHSLEEPGASNNVDVRTGLGVNGCVETEIATAFAAWSAVADIQFVEVADSGTRSGAPNATGDIRIGSHYFDGPSGILGHAYFPPVTGDTYFSIAGDLHFDSGDVWSCTTSGGIDIGLVALHEIGHSIGLKHEPISGNLAVMNPTYNRFLTGLQADDINGAVSVYGSALPALTVSHSSDPFPILASTSQITFSLHINNSSGKAATNVVITNTIPASTTYVAGTASHSGSESGGVIVWAVPTTINGNSSIVRNFRVSVTAAITDDDKLINVLSLTSAEDVNITNKQLISLVNPDLVFLPLIFK
jgi:uncharacterized repeat protein (TIGR01451 family)